MGKTKYIPIDGTKQLTVSFTPPHTSNKEATWESDNPDVVSIEETTGIMTAHGEENQTATVTVTSDDNYDLTDNCTVHIVIPISNIELSYTPYEAYNDGLFNLHKDAIANIGVTLQAEEGSPSIVNYSWNIEDTNIITIPNNDGDLTIKEVGETNVELVPDEGELRASLTVKVYYNRGDIGPAGGTIVHVQELEDGWEYIEADIIGEYEKVWGEYYYSEDLGHKYPKYLNRTIKDMMDEAGITDTAIHYCESHNKEGFIDWHLPTKEELLYIHTANYDNSLLLINKYWTCEQLSSSIDQVEVIDMSNESSPEGSELKTATGIYALPIRTFRSYKKTSYIYYVDKFLIDETYIHDSYIYNQEEQVKVGYLHEDEGEQLPGEAPDKAGFTFVGWNNNKHGTGISYETGDTFTIGIWPETLYAMWEWTESTTTGPSGGDIIYDKGEYNGGWRFLEAMNTYELDELENIEWGDPYEEDAGTDTLYEIGDGDISTEMIISIYSEAEEGECAALDISKINQGIAGKWYLPSKNELQLLYDNGIIDNGQYWSSTEYLNYGDTQVWVLNAATGNWTTEDKDSLLFKAIGIRKI